VLGLCGIAFTTGESWVALGNSLVGGETYQAAKLSEVLLTLIVTDPRDIQWRLCRCHLWLHCYFDVLLAGRGSCR
jgi:hypothetical protein